MMSDPSRPADGDIVVREQRRGHFVVYFLRAQPGPDQVVVRCRETALEQAASIATRRHVRAWLTTEGQVPVPLDRQVQAALP
jgi:hypothetical protein